MGSGDWPGPLAAACRMAAGSSPFRPFGALPVAMSWLDSALARTVSDGLPPWVGPILRAFPSAEPMADGPLPTGLSAAIVARLRGEIDGPQAELFARRFEQASGLLATIEGPAAALLHRGLHFRMAEVLAGPTPAVLRVRALVDFYVSQVARLRHKGGPPLHALAAEVTYESIAPDLRLARIAGPSDHGPVHIHVLRGRPRIRCLDPRPHTDLAALCEAQGALAGVSGGFFLHSEVDIVPPSRRTDPVGLLVTDGEVHGPPWFARGALVQTADGLDVRVVQPSEALLDGQPLRPFTRAHGEHGPDTLSRALVGRQVVASGRRLRVPLSGGVVRGAGGSAPNWSMPAIQQAMGGGPMLLADQGPCLDLVAEDFAGSAPPVTFSQDETFDQNLLPRMAAGITSAGELVLAAVDGRNVDLAPGLTLRQTAGLMASLGCVRAVNLDGGSSKRMVVRGRVVDRPSTDVVVGGQGGGPVRPTHSAILLWSAHPRGGRPA